MFHEVYFVLGVESTLYKLIVVVKCLHVNKRKHIENIGHELSWQCSEIKCTIIISN